MSFDPTKLGPISKISATAAIITIALYSFYFFIAYLPDMAKGIQQAQASLDGITLFQTETDRRFEKLIETQEEGNRIQCSACWNTADNAEEIRRCSCQPNAN